MVALRHLKDTSGELRKPVFGVMRFDGYIHVWPPVERALNKAVDALKRSGYEGLSWTCCGICADPYVRSCRL